MNKWIRLFMLIISFFIILSLTGCWSKRELNELMIVAGIGIDKAEIPGEISFIAQIVKPGEIIKPSKDSSGGDGTAFWNLNNSSLTTFDAAREFTHETSNRLYIAHTQVIVLGKDIASDSVQKQLDFFMRFIETRPSTMIVVSATTAREVLEVKPEIEKLPSMNIARITKEQIQSTSHTIPVNLQDFTARLISKTTAPVAPIVSIRNKDSKKILHVEGMAVFKGDRMAGTLTPDETRGLAWVLGKVKSGSVNIELPDGKAALRILYSKSKVIPEIKEDKLYIHIMIKESANLINQMMSNNLATLSGFSLLEQQQNSVIKSEIEAALKKAKELGTDIFGFGEKIHKKYRKEWNLMKDNWDRIFPNIEVDIKVKSSVRASGLIMKPAVPE